MLLYFIFDNGELTITKKPEKTVQRIGISDVYEFNIRITPAVKQLLKVLQGAYNKENTEVDKNLIISYVLLNIEEFENSEFKQFLIAQWQKTIKTLYHCFYPQTIKYSREPLKPEKTETKKFFLKKKRSSK